MASVSDPELQASVETSATRINSAISENLNSLPNLRSSVEAGTGKLSIEPRFFFSPYEAAPYVVKDGKREMVPGNFLERHNEVGEQVMSRVSRLIKKEFGPDNVLGSSNLAEPILSHAGSRAFLNDLYSSPLTRTLIGMDQKGEALYRPDDPSLMAINKGVPQEISEAILIALASDITKTVEKRVTEEATAIDDKYETTKKEELEGRINRLKNEQIPEQEVKSAQAKMGAETAGIQHTETAGRLESFQKAQERVDKFVYDLAGHLPPELVTNFYESLTSSSPLLTETRKLFTKKVVESATGKADLDRALADLLGGTGEIRDELSKLEVANLTQHLIRTVESSFGNYDRFRKMDGFELFEQAKRTIESIAPSEQRSKITSVLQAQRELLIKLNKKNPDQAKNVAKDMLVRATLLYLLQEGLGSQKKAPNELAESLKHYSNFMNQLNALLGEAPSYKETKREADEAKDAKMKADQHAREQESTLRTFNYSLQEADKELNILKTSKDNRVRDLKIPLLAQVLQTSHGVTPQDRYLYYHHPAQLLSVVVNSKIFTDAAKALFAGLPHFIANDDRHPSAAINVSHGRFTGRRVTEEQVKQLRDFLPETVAALLPQDHPTRELAIQLTTDLLRRYSTSDNVQIYAGFGSSEEKKEALHFRPSAKEFLAEIAKGGRILEVPADIPRIDLEQVRALNTEGKQEEANELEKAPYAKLRKFIDAAGLPDYEIMSAYVLNNPSEAVRYGFGTLSCDKASFEQGNYERALAIRFFDKPPFGTNPHYIIERKSPRRGHY